MREGLILADILLATSLPAAAGVKPETREALTLGFQLMLMLVLLPITFFLALWSMADKLALTVAVGMAFPVLAALGFTTEGRNTPPALLELVLLQDGDAMRNRSTLTKFGIELGQVLIFFRPLPAEQAHGLPDGDAARMVRRPYPPWSSPMAPRPALLALAICLLAAACQNEPVNVTYEGFECPEVPGLDDFLEAADANNDNMINSDEFNGAFEEAEDNMMPDGQLDRNELASYVCAKQKAKAAAAQ